MVDTTSVKSEEISKGLYVENQQAQHRQQIFQQQQQPLQQQQQPLQHLQQSLRGRSNSDQVVEYSQPKETPNESSGVRRQLSRKDTFKRQVRFIVCKDNL